MDKKTSTPREVILGINDIPVVESKPNSPDQFVFDTNKIELNSEPQGLDDYLLYSASDLSFSVTEVEAKQILQFAEEIGLDDSNLCEAYRIGNGPTVMYVTSQVAQQLLPKVNAEIQGKIRNRLEVRNQDFWAGIAAENLSISGEEVHALTVKLLNQVKNQNPDQERDRMKLHEFMHLTDLKFTPNKRIEELQGIVGEVRNRIEWDDIDTLTADVQNRYYELEHLLQDQAALMEAEAILHQVWGNIIGEGQDLFTEDFSKRCIQLLLGMRKLRNQKPDLPDRIKSEITKTAHSPYEFDFEEHELGTLILLFGSEFLGDGLHLNMKKMVTDFHLEGLNPEQQSHALATVLIRKIESFYKNPEGFFKHAVEPDLKLKIRQRLALSRQRTIQLLEELGKINPGYNNLEFLGKKEEFKKAVAASDFKNEKEAT